MGTLPKFPPGRREAEKVQKKAGGTMLDEMPRHGPCLDDRYGVPTKLAKRMDGRSPSVAKMSIWCESSLRKEAEIPPLAQKCTC